MSEVKKIQRPVLSVMLRLWGHMGRHRRLYVGGLALAVLDAGCQSVIPMIFRWVLNLLKDSPQAFMDQWFWPTLGLCAGLTAVFLPVAFGLHVMGEISTVRLIRDMRIRLYEHVQRMSADFFQRNKVGEIAARLNNDMDAMGQSLGAMTGLFWQTIVVVQSLAMMLYINRPLTGLFVVLMSGVALWGHYCLPRLRRITRAVRDATGEVSATVTEYVAINELIKSYSREDFALARVDAHTNALQRKAERLIWWQYVFGDILQVLVRFLAPFALLLVGALLMSRGSLQLGDLVAFWGYWLMMGGAVNWVLRGIGTIFTATASADRIFDVFDAAPLIQDAPDAKPLQTVRGEIVFTDVAFRYPTEQDQAVLEHFNLRIPAGKIVALVGPSGAGKSTILQLILRFYDPLAGVIQIDGQDIRQFAQASLRERIGMVMQESVFFAGTIEENLRLAKLDATPEELRSALRSANALDFVEEMPAGLSTLLGERGVRLSGGQKQRLSIARVFLKDPPILLLDEATSSLDSVSERLVQEAMNELMKGRTTVVVAHRISTVLGADEMFVLEAGKIIASGRHEELLKTCPLYYDLCLHQQVV
jgi:ABC-type multidrug transport system fused ATPase/permease subunit